MVVQHSDSDLEDLLHGVPDRFRERSVTMDDLVQKDNDGLHAQVSALFPRSVNVQAKKGIRTCRHISEVETFST